MSSTSGEGERDVTTELGKLDSNRPPTQGITKCINTSSNCKELEQCSLTANGYHTVNIVIIATFNILKVLSI